MTKTLNTTKRIGSPSGKPYHVTQAANGSWTRYVETNGWHIGELQDFLQTLEPLDQATLPEDIHPPAKPYWSREYPALMAICVEEADKIAVIAIRRRPRPKPDAKNPNARQRPKLTVPENLTAEERFRWCADQRKLARLELAELEPAHAGDQTARELAEQIAWLTNTMMGLASRVSPDEVCQELPGYDATDPPITSEKGLRQNVYSKLGRIASTIAKKQPDTEAGNAVRAAFKLLMEDAKDLLFWSDPMRIEWEARKAENKKTA
jgi:hypothetical protein